MMTCACGHRLHPSKACAKCPCEASAPSPETLAANILSRLVTTDEGCLIWPGTRRKGYGVVESNGRKQTVHVLVWELTNGPRPPGTDLDHTCHNEAASRGECAGGPDCRHRACANPDHLQPSTRRENLMRGLGAASLNAAKTHCKRGHEFTLENTYRRLRDGTRACKECNRLKEEQRRRTGVYDASLLPNLERNTA